MIIQKKPDPDVLERVYTSPPKLQYLWGQGLIKRLNKNKLEDVFEDFNSDKNFYNSAIKIVKIIRGNNKGDFLKTTIDREIKLVREISDNLSEEKLKKLKLKTRGRQDKEKIGLFRDLIRVSGDLDKI